MPALLNRSPLPLAGILLAGSALGAADLSWGLQLSVAAPAGDLRMLSNSSTGGDFKGYCLLDLGQGHTIRPQFDLLSFSGKPNTISTPLGTAQLKGQATIDVTMGSLGADYLYFFNGDPGKAGIYAGAGLDISSNQIKGSGGGVSLSNNATKPAYSLVAGYQFNSHWNVEASFRYSNWSTDEWTFNNKPMDLSYTLPTLMVGGGYRF